MGPLFYNLLGVKPSGFGLEIEESSVKAFMLGKDKKDLSKAIFGLRSLKKGIVQEGQVVQAEELAKEIKEVMKTARPKSIKEKFVVFSIPETKAFVRTIQIPKMTRQEASEAVKWETEANIPVSLDKVYLDWQIIGTSENGDEVLVAAVPKEIVDGYCKAITLSGLIPLAGEVDVIATIRSLTSEKNNAKPILIADIGADKTSLVICKNQVPYFSSSIPLCGKTFTDALQKGLGVSLEKAEEIKAKYGLGKMKKDDMLYNIYNPLVGNLAVEIDRSLNFYSESICSQEKVEQVLLSGGGSLLRELADYLSLRLKKTITVGNPAVGLGLDGEISESVAKDLSPFATSIGLALRGSEYES
ncbi:MAG: type IV pilus assembly protein PilM [Parcubacteria group bacterium]